MWQLYKPKSGYYKYNITFSSTCIRNTRIISVSWIYCNVCKSWFLVQSNILFEIDLYILLYVYSLNDFKRKNKSLTPYTSILIKHPTFKDYQVFPQFCCPWNLKLWRKKKVFKTLQILDVQKNNNALTLTAWIHHQWVVSLLY